VLSRCRTDAQLAWNLHLLDSVPCALSKSLALFAKERLLQQYSERLIANFLLLLPMRWIGLVESYSAHEWRNESSMSLSTTQCL
jgi:hypothetical protein